jgi:predicted Zn-dependent peptidase
MRKLPLRSRRASRPGPIRAGALALLVLLVGGVSLPAKARAADAEARILSNEKYQLTNGLTVILHEDHRLPEVVTNIRYHVGSREEPPGRSGFAHLFEHLMFMGTQRVPDHQFDLIMEAGGGSNNANTWFDRTVYYDWGPASLLPTLLWLESDRMAQLGAAMTQKKLDTQRMVVRNERREGYDNAPYGPAEYLFWQFMYPTDHPYHFDTIGSHHDLKAATVQDVVHFFDTYYVPNNATLVVAGDFQPAKVKPLIQGLFGSIPRGKEPPRRSPPPVGFAHERDEVLTDEVRYPQLTIAWHTPGIYQPGDAEMDLLASALAEGKSSRLYRRLVSQEQVAVDVSAWQTSLRLGSVFRIDCHVKPGVSLDRVESMIDEEVQKLCAQGPTPTELERARASIETSTLTGLQSLRTVADRLNHYDDYLGVPNSLERDLGRYRKATPEDVAAWGRKMLHPHRRLVLRVLPRPKPDPTPPPPEPPPPCPPKTTAPRTSPSPPSPRRPRRSSTCPTGSRSGTWTSPGYRCSRRSSSCRAARATCRGTRPAWRAWPGTCSRRGPGRETPWPSPTPWACSAPPWTSAPGARARTSACAS